MVDFTKLVSQIADEEFGECVNLWVEDDEERIEAYGLLRSAGINVTLDGDDRLVIPHEYTALAYSILFDEWFSFDTVI